MIPEKAYKTPIQIRFNDLDALGHVNNATQITYLEIARVAYFEHLVNTPINWGKEGMILAKVIVDYKLPIRLHDKVTVHIWCSAIGNKSFDFTYALTKQTDNALVVLATATTVQVCFNYEENKSILIPSFWKEKLMGNLFPAF
jgi:acyl-CoA thioester hydrolase